MAVTANQLTKRQEGCRVHHPVAASTTIYEGTIAFLTPSGYLDDDTGTAANRFGGITLAYVDNASGSAGDVKAEVYTDGVFELVGSGFSQATVGQPIYASDNYTISSAPSASSVYVGMCVGYVSSTKVLVDIDPDATSPASVVQTKTSAYTVTTGDSGKTFSTAGASGAVTFSMPAAVPGLRYRFRVGAAQELRIDPNGTETISLPSTGVPGAAGKYLTADAAGETVAIECVVAGTWAVFGYTGTWTAEA